MSQMVLSRIVDYQYGPSGKKLENIFNFKMVKTVFNLHRFYIYRAHWCTITSKQSVHDTQGCYNYKKHHKQVPVCEYVSSRSIRLYIPACMSLKRCKWYIAVVFSRNDSNILFIGKCIIRIHPENVVSRNDVVLVETNTVWVG